MGKTKSGNKNFKKKPVNGSQKLTASALESITPDEEFKFVGAVCRELGDCKFMVKTKDGIEFKVGLPGSLKKGKKIHVSDMVFFETTDIMKGIDGYILHIYMSYELDQLKIDSINIGDEFDTNGSDVLFSELNDAESKDIIENI